MLAAGKREPTNRRLLRIFEQLKTLVIGIGGGLFIEDVSKSLDLLHSGRVLRYPLKLEQFQMAVWTECDSVVAVLRRSLDGLEHCLKFV